MDTAKDIFFFIGAILGILGFINSVIQPMLTDNREKWKKLNEVINEEFFKNYDMHIQIGRHYIDDMIRLSNLHHDFKESKMYLVFKFPLNIIMSKYLRDLLSLSKKLNSITLSTSYWEKVKENEGVNVLFYELNEDKFHEKYDDSKKAINKYEQHQIKTINLVKEMRIKFKAMKVVANLRFFELPFYKLIVKNSTNNINLLSKPPEKLEIL